MNKKRLKEVDFYDVVVFGFLKAVKEYSVKPELTQKYEFSTIAFTKMNDALFKHYEKQNRQKRKAYTISLDDDIYDGEKTISLKEIISAPDGAMADFETELLLLELASKISKQEMDVIRMKMEGYEIREIAKAQKMSVKSLNELLAGLWETVLAVCYEGG